MFNGCASSEMQAASLTTRQPGSPKTTTPLININQEKILHLKHSCLKGSYLCLFVNRPDRKSRRQKKLSDKGRQEKRPSISCDVTLRYIPRLHHCSYIAVLFGRNNHGNISSGSEICSACRSGCSSTNEMIGSQHINILPFTLLNNRYIKSVNKSGHQIGVTCRFHTSYSGLYFYI